MASDPYATIGVPRGASEKDIKSAYRKLAKELHPDKTRDNPKATARFGEVTQAYDLLSDKEKRARYDRGEIDGDGNPVGFGGQRGFRADGFEGFGGGGGGGGPDSGVDLGEIFEGIFGGRSRGAGSGFGDARARPAPIGANLQFRLGVSLTDAAARAVQRITLSDGKTIDLTLPAGVEDGTQMRLSGKGESGPGGRGDAIVTIRIEPHAFFRRDGDNIRLDLPIALNEAVNGAQVKVPTAEGPVMLTIAPGSSSGKTLRLKNKGMSRKDGTRGDQLVTLQIMLPEGYGELAERLAGWTDDRPLRAKLGE